MYKLAAIDRARRLDPLSLPVTEYAKGKQLSFGKVLRVGYMKEYEYGYCLDRYVRERRTPTIKKYPCKGAL